MSETSSPVARRPWHRLMGARDPEQQHRAATPLELLFDLAFVVAIARAAAEMHHTIAENHAAQGILTYLVVFFAIWWAWMNFTWFASAYDCDDVLYRVLTILQMAGVLVLAVGIPAVFRSFDITIVVAGYVIMRVPLIIQWLRAAREDPERASTCRTYALGLTVVQVLWIALVFVPMPWAAIGLVVLIAAELAIPAYAEARGGRPTTWHREHIAERYGLLTLIVLGEVILGVTNAIAGAFEEGFSLSLLALAIGGLLLVFGLWWTYFLGGDDAGLGNLRVALTWGYGHYFVFGAIAALGAGLEVAVDAEEHIAHIGAAGAAFSVAIPVAIVLVTLASLRALVWARETRNPVLIGLLVVLLLACAALAGVVGVGLAVLLMGLVLGAGVTTFLAIAARRTERTGAG
ncbi:membrane protein [Actinomycetospora sp. NBRC 106375]|uniref:low temperature requirement protein A n=1 Tax=Actinomycetospora sp. NBRC 106375 TaxID=3032207 RepID=UPI0024A56781|nr:low temperature requirement protein A [Actinomycetospora sp. NBRC 106375]GLZ46631.1 membrane protein [Actinomycetospora sp. NBRC 106375]